AAGVRGRLPHGFGKLPAVGRILAGLPIRVRSGSVKPAPRPFSVQPPPARHAPTGVAMPDLIPLAQARCTPRKGGEHQPRPARLPAVVPPDPGGEPPEDGRALSKPDTFKDYYRTMSFVNALAHTANREDHQPDLGVHYDRCVVRYSTHDVGGLSENDFICAAKADLLVD